MFNHYTEFLEREFSKRNQKNASYSLRAFARDLGCSHQSLSAILNQKQGLSLGTAKKMAQKLGLTGLEEKLFLALVKQKHHRSLKERTLANAEVQRLQQELSFKQYDPEIFKMIAGWEHSAILALTSLADFQMNPMYVKQRTGIPVAAAQKSLDRLQKLGLIKKDATGKWKQENPGQIFNSRDLSEAHQKHYIQLSKISQNKIVNVPRDQREYSNMFLSLTKDDYDFVVEKVTRFRRELIAEIVQRGGDSDRVYSLFIQFFPVTVGSES